MTNLLECECCHEKIKPNPRSKNQKYCSKAACQRARKRKWQKDKMASDPDYRKTQREASIEWHKKNLDYYKKYRAATPDYVQKNREAQKTRNAKKRMVAKMDALTDEHVLKPGLYHIVGPVSPGVAKMDTSLHELFIIPAGYRKDCLIAKKDTIDGNGHLQ